MHTKARACGKAGETSSAVEFSLSCDSQVVATALVAELPPDTRSQAGVVESDSSVYRTKSHLGMTNYGRLSSHRLMVASGQFSMITGIGDLRMVYVCPSDVRPLFVVQPTDMLHIPGHDSNLFLLRSMEAEESSFYGRNSEISLFCGKRICDEVQSL